MEITGSADGTVSFPAITGAAAGSLEIEGTAASAVKVFGASAGDLDLTGSATTTVTIYGVAAGLFGLTGSATGGRDRSSARRAVDAYANTSSVPVTVWRQQGDLRTSSGQNRALYQQTKNGAA